MELRLGNGACSISRSFPESASFRSADFFVNHQLAINEFYCGLKYGRPPLDGVALGKWRMFHKPIVPGKRLLPIGRLLRQSPTCDQRILLRPEIRQTALRWSCAWEMAHVP